MARLGRALGVGRRVYHSCVYGSALQESHRARGGGDGRIRRLHFLASGHVALLARLALYRSLFRLDHRLHRLSRPPRMKAVGIATTSLLLAALFGCATTLAPTNSRAPFTINGPQGRLVVDDGGTGGIPILFVHGNGGNRSQWAAQLAYLRHSRRAVAFDLRGMGESALPANSDYSVEGFAETSRPWPIRLV